MGQNYSWYDVINAPIDILKDPRIVPEEALAERKKEYCVSGNRGSGLPHLACKELEIVQTSYCRKEYAHTQNTI